MSEHSLTYYYRLLFKAFADELDFHVLKGVVTEVDTDEKNCVVKPDSDQPEFNDVKYVVNPSKNFGIVRVPKVGSQVTIGVLEAIGGTQATIVDMQEFEELVYDAGTETIMGSVALTAKLNNLTDEIRSMNAKINANTAAIKSHTHILVVSAAGAPTGTGSDVPATTATSPALISLQDVVDPVDFDQADYEYNKIKFPLKNN